MKTSKTFRGLLHIATAVTALSLIVAPVTTLAAIKGPAELPQVNTPADTKAQPAPMNCPKCKDTAAVKAGNPVKDKAGAQTAQIHQCPACQSKVTTTGTGKQAVDKVVHGCSMATSDAAIAPCCTKK